MAETIEVDGETVRVRKTDDGFEAKASDPQPKLVFEDNGGERLIVEQDADFELVEKDNPFGAYVIGVDNSGIAEENDVYTRSSTSYAALADEWENYWSFDTIELTIE
jgi:hypothetical protein